jgi:hypothetical protein
MKVVYHKSALKDLNSVFSYVAKDDPLAALKIVNRIRQVSDLLVTSLFSAGRDGAAFGSCPLRGCPMSLFIASLPIRCRLLRSFTRREIDAFDLDRM